MTARAKGGRVAERVSRLVDLPWTVELRRNSDGTFFARIVELPGCMTEGPTQEEAVAHLREALELWLETELARGASIPAPQTERTYSGTFTVRTSPLVHRLAAGAAERLGVSLNEFASEALALAAGASGWKVPTPRRAAGRSAPRARRAGER